MDGINGIPTAKRYTIDGEVIVRRFFNSPAAALDFVKKNPGKPLPPEMYWEAEDALEVIDYDDALDKKLTPQLKTLMQAVYDAGLDIKAMKNRQVPLTRTELSKFHGKKIITKLCDLGLLAETVISLRQGAADGKAAGARAVIYFTPMGRAYVRKHIAEGFGLKTVYYNRDVIFGPVTVPGDATHPEEPAP